MTQWLRSSPTIPPRLRTNPSPVSAVDAFALAWVVQVNGSAAQAGLPLVMIGRLSLWRVHRHDPAASDRIRNHESPCKQVARISPVRGAITDGD